MTDKSIGLRIKHYREMRGVTQEKLAEQIGISVGFMSKIEQGAKCPSLENFIAIANALKISANEILIDVLDTGCEVKASELSERISGLPVSEQKKILAVVETMLDAAGN